MSRAPSNGGVGVVHLVGAGPGAPDLLTLRAARLLAEADIVFHDALVHPEVLALAVRARKIAVGKRCGRLSTAQRFINRQLIDAALHHRTVVRLKGGDPMLFGRAQEEIDALEAAGVRVEVVPGISAAFGAAADLSRSLTLRGASRSVTFITPAVGPGEAEHDWARPAAAADTVALYMASRRAAEIAQGLIAQGVPADRPVVLVENATLPNRRVHATRLSGLAQAAAGLGDGPALLLVGEVYRALLEAPADADLEGASQRHSDVDSLLSLPSRLPVRAAA
ncbi:uroporphyrinogen-III C-methyltransferase [Quisquiliibacterium transsilvanicum]|uniref:uroporphyrinogen-III C-methyltransferase n=1 Tax=Quisquiliibacterium transsilvanicum TaxID=1549638 RepID=A0A7W8HFV6_9BURK|nr:uroporphyrinogen-III C-methyltransferase [Quisquiliibacterium transsilvanicum]MBB5270696.1 uroporphyrin-III C-methyltransferase [Quisquiliibacterium transsilvanicum]